MSQGRPDRCEPVMTSCGAAMAQCWAAVIQLTTRNSPNSFIDIVCSFVSLHYTRPMTNFNKGERKREEGKGGNKGNSAPLNTHQPPHTKHHRSGDGNQE